MNKKYKWLLKQALQTREARIFLYYVMHETHLFEHGFVPGDAHATSFHAGQRSIGFFIYDAIMEIDPNLFVKMRAEFEEFAAPKKEGN